jgi:hypothetical protein
LKEKEGLNQKKKARKMKKKMARERTERDESIYERREKHVCEMEGKWVYNPYIPSTNRFGSPGPDPGYEPNRTLPVP